jgi:hypothetical protein
MPTVVVSAHKVLEFPDGGGHFSAYIQYAHGLRANGCDVWWLEQMVPSDDRDGDARKIAALAARLAVAGLGDRLIIYAGACERARSYLTVTPAEAERVFREAELLVNFHYELDEELLARFRRTALVDIDPGLLQLWMHEGHLRVAPHDLHFTTGETVGTNGALFPSCGIDWIHIRPPVSLEHWPLVRDAQHNGFTTVSSWWGDEWMTDGDGRPWYENNKRVSFLEYAELPRRVSVALELAINTGPGDAADVRLLERAGWRLRHTREVAATPAAYRDYVRSSQGEFSCAKPSCMRLQNAWISDRTICYLASGLPAVVQYTGPSSALEGGAGLLRFSSLAEAADALNQVGAHYEAHRVAAHELAATHFDARKVAAHILDAALANGAQRAENASA